MADGDLETAAGRCPRWSRRCVQDGVAKLMLRPDVQGADVLRQLVGFLNVHEFRSEEPELEQIFLKAVHDAA